MADVVRTEVPFAGLLWPGGGRETSYVALRRGGMLRSLLPAESPLVLRQALAHSNGPESRLRHLVRESGAAVVAGHARVRGVPGLVEAPGGDLQDRISELAGSEVLLALHFGPPRANRKPVIQAFDLAGRLVAVAKLGVGDLTAELVAHEAALLGAWQERATQSTAGSPVLVVPRSLGLTTWSGQPLLVQEALRLPRRHAVPSAARRRSAEHRLAGLSLPSLHGNADEHTGDAYAAGLRARLRRLPPAVPAQVYVDALDRVADTVDLAS